MDTVKLKKAQYMHWLFQGNEFFWAGSAFSPTVDFWKNSLWRPTFLSLCCCSFFSAKFCYSQVTILIHCPSADKSDGRRHNCYIKGRRALPMSMYSLNRALLLLSPSAPLSFFLKNNILILFSSKEKKNSEHSKMVTREQNDNFCTFVLIECNFFFALWKLVAAESYQKLAYLNLQLCKLENFKMLQYFNAFLGSLFKINFAKCVLFI